MSPATLSARWLCRCGGHFQPDKSTFSVSVGISRPANSQFSRSFVGRNSAILYGHQKAGTRIARPAFIGAQLNIVAAWLYQRELHRPAADGTRQLGGLKIGATWRRRGDFHIACFRKSVNLVRWHVHSGGKCDAFDGDFDGPDRAVVRIDACGSANLFDKPSYQPESMPLAFGFRQEAGTIVADGHGRDIAGRAMHRYND
jgi:hypothetical protein